MINNQLFSKIVSIENKTVYKAYINTFINSKSRIVPKIKKAFIKCKIDKNVGRKKSKKFMFVYC